MSPSTHRDVNLCEAAGLHHEVSPEVAARLICTDPDKFAGLLQQTLGLILYGVSLEGYVIPPTDGDYGDDPLLDPAMAVPIAVLYTALQEYDSGCGAKFSTHLVAVARRVASDLDGGRKSPRELTFSEINNDALIEEQGVLATHDPCFEDEEPTAQTVRYMVLERALALLPPTVQIVLKQKVADIAVDTTQYIVALSSLRSVVAALLLTYDTDDAT